MKSLIIISLIIIGSAFTYDSKAQLISDLNYGANPYGKQTKVQENLMGIATLVKEEKWSLVIKKLERALNVDLFEEPNIFLWDDLAIVSHLVGETGKAKKFLSYHAVVLDILTGEIKCYLTSDDELIDNVNDKVPVLIAKELCHPTFTYDAGPFAKPYIVDFVKKERIRLKRLQKIIR